MHVMGDLCKAKDILDINIPKEEETKGIYISLRKLHRTESAIYRS